MLKRTIACATVGVLAVLSPLSAAPKKPAPVTLEEVIKKVQDQQKKTQTLQANFRQEKELALLAKPEVSTGTFIFSKPNSVRWSYNAPKKVEMLIAGGTLTTYYPELGKAERLDVRRF